MSYVRAAHGPTNHVFSKMCRWHRQIKALLLSFLTPTTSIAVARRGYSKFDTEPMSQATIQPASEIFVAPLLVCVLNR